MGGGGGGGGDHTNVREHQAFVFSDYFPVGKKSSRVT
jgi:hypothetical protein